MSDNRIYTQLVSWRRRPSSLRPAPGSGADIEGGDDAVDRHDPRERSVEDLTPSIHADVHADAVAAPRHLARRRDAGEIEIVFEPHIERMDEQATESHPLPRSAAPSLDAGSDADIIEGLRAGRALGAEGFVSIDFETATSSRASACAVAVGLVADGQVEDVRRWLIQPPENEYDGFNISLHGITPDMTQNSPTIDYVWPEIAALVGARPLVAHYAAFDMSVLRSALTARGSDWPNLTYTCTRALARRAWPGMVSYRLIDLADECGLTLEHHEPGADAATAAELAIACCGHSAERLLIDACRVLGVAVGELSSDGWTPSGVAQRRLSALSPTVDQVPEDGPFAEKTVAFTGTLTCGLSRAQAAQLIVNAGGHAMASVSKKVNYLVLGMQDATRLKDGSHSGKMLRAIELQRTGAPIELLSENDFLRMLPG